MASIHIVRMGDDKFALADEEWAEVKALLEKYSRLKTYTVTAVNSSEVRPIIQAIIHAMKGDIGMTHVTGPNGPECKISFQRIVDPDPAEEETFDLIYGALATSNGVKSCDPPPKPPN